MRFPGQIQVVFLVKGPIYLVCISCTDETYEYLRGQLDLLYGQVKNSLLLCILSLWHFHVWVSGLNNQNAILVMQMILILTKSIDRCFEKNAKFDMTPLLGGTDAVFSSLVHSFSWFVSNFQLFKSTALYILSLLFIFWIIMWRLRLLISRKNWIMSTISLELLEKFSWFHGSVSSVRNQLYTCSIQGFKV